MLRKVLASVAIVSTLFLLIGLFLPKRVDISKSITIHAPLQYVFEELNELDRWWNWSYLQTTNPRLQINFEGRRSGQWASYNWHDEGGGELLIKASEPDTLIRVEVYLHSDTVKISYHLKERNDTTFLVADLKRNGIGNLFTRWHYLFSTFPFSEKAFNKELQKIKQIAEEKPIFTIPITEESLAPTYYIYLSIEGNRKDKKEILAGKINMYEKLKKALSNANTQRIAPPFCIYPNINQESTDIICAFTISPDARFPENFPVLQHYSGAAVRGIHNGGHYSLKKTHEELLSYIRYKNYEKNGAPWEVYLSDITNEKDSSDWVTEVYYPIK